MWRIIKHSVNVLFYPFLGGHRAVQLLLGGKMRAPTGQLLDYTLQVCTNNVAWLEETNRSANIGEHEPQVILEIWKERASARLTDESIVNWCVGLVLFPVRSFRIWPMKRRLAKLIGTGPINTWITELHRRAWASDI